MDDEVDNTDRQTGNPDASGSAIQAAEMHSQTSQDMPQCPRCGGALFDHSEPARFYGPCADCRRQLRDALRGEGGEAVVAEYEPKMNVTPNAVALKDD